MGPGSELTPSRSADPRPDLDTLRVVHVRSLSSADDQPQWLREVEALHRVCCYRRDVANDDASDPDPSDPGSRVPYPGTPSVRKESEARNYGVRSARCNPIAIIAPAITEME